MYTEQILIYISVVYSNVDDTQNKCSVTIIDSYKFEYSY